MASEAKSAQNVAICQYDRHLGYEDIVIEVIDFKSEESLDLRYCLEAAMPSEAKEIDHLSENICRTLLCKGQMTK